ncbi:MAG: hypothetical protein CL908_12425 [Deltaproteobacteria bacterium]|jgi:hypothetical protein|nr:hypothetical protein [Deltaproteobacteria bacterium]
MNDPNPPKNDVSRRRAIGFRLIAIFLSLGSVLVLGECSTRTLKGAPFSTEPARSAVSHELDGARAIYDAELGYVPKPGRHVSHFVTTITPERLRRADSMPRPPGPTILATGDSFTFGDDVDDDQSWPAHLEVRLGRPVLNGGVFGYGLDQSVLRAETLIQIHRPSIVLLSMIPDDIERTELAYRYAWKPYFHLAGHDLQLRNVPVPIAPPPTRFRALREALRHSHLAHSIFRRVTPYWWYLDGNQQKVHDDGDEVARRLMKRIARHARKHDVRLPVVAQCDAFLETERLKPVLESAAAAGLEVLDLPDLIAESVRTGEWTLDELYLGREGGRFGGHHTPRANQWIAMQITAKLEQLGW